MMELGSLRLDLISDGLFEDDADTFVRRCAEAEARPGLKVRARRRIRVGFNALLVRGGGKTVILDPGTGDKPRETLAKAYHLEWPRRFLPTLDDLGVRREQVDAVILTHLHWDHAGACTRIAESGKIEATFPHARYLVHRRELDSARKGGDGYLLEDFMPLAEHGRLELVERDGEVLPGFEVRWSGGHTPGHQIALIGNEGAPRAVYLSDLIPTAAQLPLECGLSYDVNADELRRAKAKILEDAHRDNDLLLFVHAPTARAGRLTKIADGGYRLASESI
ncbi:MAG: MBL fold metallo-hydrolase [bacterium]|nr:MBL fold metallo-hydrolase [bacterium]